MVTTNDGNLVEITNGKMSPAANFKCRSAIYNKTGDFVLVLKSYSNDDPDHSHISIFKSGALDQPPKEIKLSFPQEIKRNYFQAYFMTEYGDQSQTFIYSAFFETDDDKNDNIGLPMVFSIDKDITLDSTFDSLKPSTQYHFNTDLTHNNDEDG